MLCLSRCPSLSRLLAGAVLRTSSTFAFKPKASGAAVPSSAWACWTSVYRMKNTGFGGRDGGGPSPKVDPASNPKVARLRYLIATDPRGTCSPAHHNGGRDGGGPSPKVDPASNPKVARLRDLVATDPRAGWDECWKEELTPWDLRQPTPVILDLMQTDSLPKGRVLVPGCGTGYDVVAIAGPERYVVGLDISENAVKKSEALFSSQWNADNFTFVAADFFTWCPSQLFDLIYDYTFFSAIDPSMRSAWARQIQNLLVPDGELLTLIYPNDNFVGGPPFAVSVSAYEDVLGPLGFVAVSVDDNALAIGPRKGRELIARWKRSPNQSCL